ncbi:MAG TPA: DUF2399 domain-containing protein [Actinomycetes bacterium]|nr:DUF2399 domain-containing protein [Actinomycetes bacterium]
MRGPPSADAEALKRFGNRCPPVVCASGWPNTAVIELLRQLGRTGSRIMYHGDLDGKGLRIASYVVVRTGALPWRMTTADYVAAVARTGTPPGRTGTPTGRTGTPTGRTGKPALRIPDVPVAAVARTGHASRARPRRPVGPRARRGGAVA